MFPPTPKPPTYINTTLPYVITPYAFEEIFKYWIFVYQIFLTCFLCKHTQKMKIIFLLYVCSIGRRIRKQNAFLLTLLRYDPSEHVITGEINIDQDRKIKNLFEKKTKISSFNWNIVISVVRPLKTIFRRIEKIGENREKMNKLSRDS